MSFQTERYSSMEQRLVMAFEEDRLTSSLLDIASSPPARSGLADQMKGICKAWRKFADCSSVWLWLFNELTDQWEIVAADASSQHSTSIDRVTSTNRFTAAGYVCAVRKPLRITDLENWKATINGDRYSVNAAGNLRKCGCVAFDCIPLQVSHLPTDALRLADYEARTDRVGLRSGALCLHYSKADQPKIESLDSILSLARLSSLTLAQAYQSHQQAMLLAFGSIAEVALEDTNKPTEALEEYLAGVLKLTKEVMRVRGCSIFIETERRDAVRCIASTGLCDRSTSLVPKSRLHRAEYHRGEGKTGMCYNQNLPRIVHPDTVEAANWKFTEIERGRVVGENGSILFPISARNVGHDNSSKRAEDEVGDYRAIGVLRCAEHASLVNGAYTRPFDAVDLQSLAFITRQIGPTITHLNKRVIRERTISIVKHDLRAPIWMMRDASETLDSSSGAHQSRSPSARFHDLMDLRLAALHASVLVDELDPDPANAVDFVMQETLLFGDVIAPIRNLLAYSAMQDNKMTISFVGLHNIPPIMLNRRSVERVFVNLLTNAIKYGERGSEIRVKAAELQTQYEVSISNKGMGVAEKDSELIFEQNYQSSLAKRKKIGLGLGLYISRAIMREHGGDVILFRLANPTIFSVLFPKPTLGKASRDE